MKKKILSLLLALVFVVTAFPLGAVAAFAAEASTDATVVSVESASALGGSTVDVNVTIKNNPGILAASLTFTYSEGLTLTAASNGEAFSHLTMTKPGQFVSPCTFVWDASEIADSDIKDGTVLTLTFAVSEEVEAGTDLIVNVSCNKGDVIDGNLNAVSVATVGGVVSIIDFTPGDLNNDGTVSPLDLVFMRRYLASGYDISIIEEAADVNADGFINVTDLVLIRRYLAGGYDVDLTPSHKKCEHELMMEIEAREVTCTENGNIAYWYCPSCENCYADSSATEKVAYEDVVIEAEGHKAVVDPAVEPTYESTGLTEGSHCSVCGEVLVAQKVLPKLEKDEYSITYYISNNDSYLAGITIENPNPSVYTAEDGLRLANLNVPGYVFEGWYDGAGSNGELVKTIAKGETGDIELYARWTLVEYTVMFESELIPVESTAYTVDKGTVLPSPSLDGYIFAGWSDDEGNIIKKISVGTTGHKTYMANWLSERNQAWTKTKLDAPIVYEDENVILFTYEIGEIRNVPLYVIHDFGKINSNGVEKTVTKTYSTTVSESQMETYTETVSKATTDSYGWTLSNGWSESVSVNEEWAKENGITTEEAQTICTTDSGNWYVSNGSSGSTTSQQLDITDSHKLETSTNNKKSYGNTETNASTNMEAHVDLTLESKIAPGTKGSINTGVSVGAQNSATVQKGWSNDDTTGSEEGSSERHETNLSNTASWNSSSGYGGSSSTSNSITVSKAISEKISQKYGYGEQYINTGDESQTQGYVSSEASSDQYSSSVVYSTVTTEEVTATYTTSNTMSGYHRWIMAGTAHVFAVVGYDIATKSYFVYNYTVMDDEIHEFEDYSYSYSSYNDNENGIIKFEAPTDIVDYVADRVCESDGLEVSKDGVITGYSGTDTFVVIPEYKVIKNLDGTPSVIKVTGISADAFRGNESIQVVGLSDFITDIPEGAFENCTALEEVYGANVSCVGDRAFAGCVSVKNGVIGDLVETMGDDVFAGLDSLSAKAANMSIVKAALASGAKNIKVEISDKCTDLSDITLKVTDSTNEFTFNGYGKEFSNVYIESDAAKTAVHRAVFHSTSKAPLRISSPDVVFQEVNVTSPSLGIILSAETANVALYGESYVTTASSNTMLSKNIVLSKLNNDYYSHLTVTGNYLICGEVTNSEYLTVQEGELITIDAATFDKYANGVVNVTFNANGGTVSTSQKSVCYGDSYGELPVPQRSNYTFAGWYTQASGGTEVLADTLVTSFENHTLYARWSANTFTVTFNGGGGNVTTTSKTVTFGNAYGTLPTPTRTGFKFLGWYNPGGAKVTADTVQTTASNITLTARWTPVGYHVTWNTGTGYTIVVKRTSSPYAGAVRGELAYGATVFYGDVLSISYVPASNYEIVTHGATSVTVVDFVTPTTIYATAKLKATHIRTLNSTAENRIRYYMEIYVAGNQLLIKGWMYDVADPGRCLTIDINSIYRSDTDRVNSSCPVAGNHGFEIYQGPYSGNQRIMIHTWASGVANPILLWDSFSDSGYPQCWVPFPS